MSRELQRLGKFTVTREDGSQLVLVELQELIPVPSRGDPHAVAPGLKRLVTEDGDPANREAKGRYRLVSTGEILTSDDPAAP